MHKFLNFVQILIQKQIKISQKLHTEDRIQAYQTQQKNKRLKREKKKKRKSYSTINNGDDFDLKFSFLKKIKIKKETKQKTILQNQIQQFKSSMESWNQYLKLLSY